MKINSKFTTKCPGCGKAIIGQGGSGWPWDCLFCLKPVCEWCYHEHTVLEHQEKPLAKKEGSER
jgi:hypothetical protein